MRQDQKSTPIKFASRSGKKRMLDEALSKDLLCPFAEGFPFGLIANYTPLRKQPQYLLSPSPVKKDLFSQLLGTQTKHNSPVEQNEQPIEEQEMSMSDMSSQEDDSMIEECSSENQANWSDENGIKKRKRKSTAQIKLLKQQLDGEMNWTKEKIVRMAEVTGLSQSQVYKWCWDQKKKQNKGREQYSRNYHQKRRFIKKPIGLRQHHESRQRGDEHEHESEQQQQHHHHNHNNHNNEQQNKENLKYDANQMSHLSNMRRTMTKLKSSVVMTDAHDTQKKVSKRLVFY